MGDARRKAAAFAAELAGAYPSQVKGETLRAWAAAFQDIGLDIADDVSALLRMRSTFPPSVAQIYETAREVRKETMSGDWSTWDCIFADGVVCPNCTREEWGNLDEPVVHGRLLTPKQLAVLFRERREQIASIGAEG